ncbi:hypothetical protein EJB05_01096 [Eragrostis curvula]|uniref:Uncharacterized protein n=1 Tax=Eragrostis curvula TaxID=38414 RepID=A0A5J9WR18_9POAL|nr:hypothetical protein EJB05_01096 [Eragrostis curvula]
MSPPTGQKTSSLARIMFGDNAPPLPPSSSSRSQASAKDSKSFPTIVEDLEFMEALANSLKDEQKEGDQPIEVEDGEEEDGTPADTHEDFVIV